MKTVNAQPKQYNHYLEQEGAFSPRKVRVEHKELKPGIYELAVDATGNSYFVPTEVKTDHLLRLPNSVSEVVMEDVRQFWADDTRQLFGEYGVIYKRGYLLHGIPGTGKSATINLISEDFIAAGGVVILNPNPAIFSKTFNMVKDIETNKRMMVVWEDFESLCNSADFLALLDGQLALDNVVYVATTNYIDKVPPRIRNRPSRFAVVKELPKLSEEIRRSYLVGKLKGEHLKNVEEWVTKTDGLTIDQIKDIIVTVCCFKQTLTHALNKINELSEPSVEKMDFNVKAFKR
jgi:hypothetical protein